MTLKRVSEKETVNALDRQALTEIYEQFSSDIFRYAYRLLNDHELAEDCVADAFHRLLMAMHGGTSIDNMRAYLYRIAHNWVTDHFRRNPLSAVMLDDELHADPEGNPANLASQRMDRQRVRRALLQLSPEQRQVIELRFMENWSHQQVAEALGKNVDATRALQHRGLESLRQILSELSPQE
jgi:RNA polymerase sigma-70 factor (ECF subfamily)